MNYRTETCTVTNELNNKYNDTNNDKNNTNQRLEDRLRRGYICEKGAGKGKMLSFPY